MKSKRSSAVGSSAVGSHTVPTSSYSSILIDLQSKMNQHSHGNAMNAPFQNQSLTSPVAVGKPQLSFPMSPAVGASFRRNIPPLPLIPQNQPLKQKQIASQMQYPATYPATYSKPKNPAQSMENV